MIIIELKTWNGNGSVKKIETKVSTRWESTMDIQLYYFGFENLSEVKRFLDDRRNNTFIELMESMEREGYKYCEEITDIIYINREATEENRERAKEIMYAHYGL